MEKVLLEDGKTVFDPKVWLDKATAAKLFGIASRTIERWQARGWIRPQYYKPSHSNRLAVYYRPDLEKALQRSREQPVAARQVPTGTTTTRPTPRQNGAVRQENRGLPTVKGPTYLTPATVGPTALSGLIPPWKKLYLTMDEARAYTGLPKTYLEEMVEKKKVKKIPGRWLLRRADLEKL
jgi:hypothetical protein